MIFFGIPVQLDENTLKYTRLEIKTWCELSGRIRLERGGGAWCPGQRLDADVVEYLQIDLGQLNVITHVETQGRFGNGQVSARTIQRLIVIQRQNSSKEKAAFVRPSLPTNCHLNRIGIRVVKLVLIARSTNLK